MNTVVLNSNNIVAGTNNSTLLYNFPNSVKFTNHQVAVQSVNMYYSWQNINSTSLKNNTFTYTWVVAGTTTTYTVTIPNGLYEITDINNYSLRLLLFLPLLRLNSFLLLFNTNFYHVYIN